MTSTTLTRTLTHAQQTSLLNLVAAHYVVAPTLDRETFDYYVERVAS